MLWPAAKPRAVWRNIVYERNTCTEACSSIYWNVYVLVQYLFNALEKWLRKEIWVFAKVSTFSLLVIGVFENKLMFYLVQRQHVFKGNSCRSFLVYCKYICNTLQWKTCNYFPISSYYSWRKLHTSGRWTVHLHKLTCSTACCVLRCRNSSSLIKRNRCPKCAVIYLLFKVQQGVVKVRIIKWKIRKLSSLVHSAMEKIYFSSHQCI